MMEFLVYEGKVAAALLVFYLFYRFLLKQETFHRFNRVVLVGTAVLSFLLPLCIITIRKPVEMDLQVTGQAVAMPELSAVEMASAAEPSAPWWQIALTILFWAGVAFVLARVIISIFSILRIIRQGEQVRQEDDCKIIVTDRDLDPFSWMRYIVLSRKDWEGDHAPILAHEKAHIAYGHSVELLLVDVLSALQWFNPAIWMLRADLQELHEYEADDAVLRGGANLREYQYLLIRKAVGKSGYSVANSFNHSILKNRITMMSKTKSSLARGLRALYLLPLICLGLGLQARTVYVPTDKDSKNVVTDEGNQDVQEKIVAIHVDADGKILIDDKECLLSEVATRLQSLKVPGLELVASIDQAPDTPEAVQLELRNQLRQAGVLKTRHSAQVVTPLYILRQPGSEEKEMTKDEFDAIDRHRISSIEVMDDADARQIYGDRAANGVVVFTMKRPQELDEVVVVSYRDNQDEEVPFYLLNPDTMPTFQGEDLNGFSRWLARHIVRPKTCDHTGTVKVSFEVGTDGRVRDVKIIEGICEELDALVVATVEKSPEWEPATYKGRPVAQGLTIPVVFVVRQGSRK
ncbi:MAG: TonB family protein [Bacteroidales bacterium]|nr:TonB family protein [Bacteroidales bacterium]